MKKKSIEIYRFRRRVGKGQGKRTFFGLLPRKERKGIS
jgi:hypothetical protein